MADTHSFNSLIEQTIKENWDRNALSDYKGATLQYHDVARKIEKLRILFEESGVRHGDKIALCGRNSSAWAAAFLAILAYGAVAVPIQHEFTPEQIYNIVEHSDSRLLLVGDVVATTLDYDRMPSLEGVIYLPDSSILLDKVGKLTAARERLNEIFGHKFPKYFRQEHIAYHHDSEEEVAMINYTSGTTGFSKGVMLPYRCLWSNVDFLRHAFTSKLPSHCDVLAILPMAHMYGMSCEFLVNFCSGNHIFFLNRLPSPTIIQEAFAAIHPSAIVSVPLIVEKIIRQKVFPIVNNQRTRLLLKVPGVKGKMKNNIRDLVMDVMGGNAYEVLVGGAGLNREIESFLIDIGFPITVGYGTTETGPMISFADWHNFVPGSCGTVAEHMELKVDSPDPQHIAGEVLTRGMNTLLGYYKNPDATKAAFTEDGWFRTGDLGRMDASGNLFLLGRIKNMLLGANGQNVYPEEIENELNSMAMVGESLIVQRGDKLVGLVHPDMETANTLRLSSKDLEEIMEQNRRELNAKLPSFCRLSTIQLTDKEFEKTSKKSIKRYLYQ